jgi:hypothetical protein
MHSYIFIVSGSFGMLGGFEWNQVANVDGFTVVGSMALYKL